MNESKPSHVISFVLLSWLVITVGILAMSGGQVHITRGTEYDQVKYVQNNNVSLEQANSVVKLAEARKLNAESDKINSNTWLDTAFGIGCLGIFVFIGILVVTIILSLTVKALSSLLDGGEN